MLERIADIIDREPWARAPEYDVVVYRGQEDTWGVGVGAIYKSDLYTAINWVKDHIMPVVPEGWTITLCGVVTDGEEVIIDCVWSSQDKE
jgi:hypothetical protein